MPALRKIDASMPPGEAAAATWKLRLHAWWEGYELPEAPPPAPTKVRLPPRPLAKPGPAAAASGNPDSPLNKADLRVLRALWGGDFVTPGDGEHVIELVKPLGLNPKMSMLDFGAGIGGPARAMAKEFGVWITGLEPSRDFVQAGMELSAGAGMAKRVVISGVETEKPVLPERRFDCIFAKESLGVVPDKDRLFAAMSKSLKPGGHVLLTDYVLTREDGDQENAAWVEQNRAALGIGHPWRQSELHRAMDEAGLDLRINEDITDLYMKLVLGRWQLWESFARDLDDGSADAPERMQLLLDKAKLWTSRMAALRASDIRIYRFHAIKKPTQKLMSNW